jgi:glutathione synthase/RimK-type ligase-like ATP-grasp enzyme
MNNSKHIVFVDNNDCGIVGLNTALNRGHTVTFIQSKSLRYEHQPVNLESVLSRLNKFILVDNIYSEETLEIIFQDLLKESSIDAVITVRQKCTLPLAKVAYKLGLTYNSVSSVEIACDKFLCRNHLKNAGIPSVNYSLVSSSSEAVKVAISMGFPVVIKPSGGCQSLFVKVANNTDEVIDYFQEYPLGLQELETNFKSVIASPLLMEEYLDGRMLSVEAGISNGEFVVFTIGERKRYSKNEAIELGTILPAPISSSEWNKVSKYTELLTRSINFKYGIFHIEVMLTKDGVRLIEFNPRLMGGTLPIVYNYIYKDNIYDYLIDTHLGNKFKDRPSPPTQFVCSRIIASAENSITHSDFDLSWVDQYQQFDFQLYLYIKPGDRVRQVKSTNRDYIGSFRLRDSCPEKANMLADQIISHLSHSLEVPLMN